MSLISELFGRMPLSLRSGLRLSIVSNNQTMKDRMWWRMTGSNRRPPACKAGALPAELIPLFRIQGTGTRGQGG